MASRVFRSVSAKPWVSERLGAMIGAPARIEIRKVGILERDAALPPSGAVVLLGLEGRLGALFLGADLGHRLVDAAARPEGEPLSQTALQTSPLLPAEEGILLYLAASAMADAFQGSTVRPEILGVVDDGGPFFRLESRGRYAILSLALDAPALSGSAWLVFPADLDLAVFASSGANTSSHGAEHPASVILIAGEVELDRKGVKSLEPGDVVLPDRISCRAGESGSLAGEVLLRAGDLSLRAGLVHQRELQIIERQDMAMEDKTGNRIKATVEPPEDIVLSPDDLPVPITIEVGRLTLRAGEVAMLGPGSVVETDRPIGVRAELRTGGKLLATGDLVDVDGKVGVRITRIWT